MCPRHCTGAVASDNTVLDADLLRCMIGDRKKGIDGGGGLERGGAENEEMGARNRTRSSWKSS